jgi:F-type H+-transporting ATPase subunit delta
MAQNDALARPYAQAVFELAQADGSMAAWSALLRVAGQVAADSGVLARLSVPGADPEQVVGLIADVCAADPEAAPVLASGAGRNFLRLLAENRRVPVLPDIAAGFERLRADAERTVDVVLTTATPVDDAQQARMTAALKQRFGRDVRLRVQQDDSLIGGARLQADDHVIDGSVRTRLEKLASALVQ